MNDEDRNCKLCNKQVDHYGRCRNSSCELELRPQHKNIAATHDIYREEYGKKMGLPESTDSPTK